MFKIPNAYESYYLKEPTAWHIQLESLTIWLFSLLQNQILKTPPNEVLTAMERVRWEAMAETPASLNIRQIISLSMDIPSPSLGHQERTPYIHHRSSPWFNNYLHGSTIYESRERFTLETRVKLTTISIWDRDYTWLRLSPSFLASFAFLVLLNLYKELVVLLQGHPFTLAMTPRVINKILKFFITSPCSVLCFLY